MSHYGFHRLHIQVKNNSVTLSPLCPQQSGRSWASPARRRGPERPLHSIHITRDPTDSQSIQDMTTHSGKSNQQRGQDDNDDNNHINSERGRYFGTEKQWSRGDGRRPVTLIAVTPRVHFTKACVPAASLPHLTLILLLLLLPLRASWRTMHGLKGKQMSLCKDDLSLSLCPIITRKQTNTELFDGTV